MRGWYLGAGLRAGMVVVMVAGCGSTTRNKGDAEPVAGAGGSGSAGSGSAGGGSAGRPSPMKDGVPIGDCREAEESSNPPDCPEAPPGPDASCYSPNAITRCAYDIYVTGGDLASQRVFTCHPEQHVWSEFGATCGKLCGETLENVIALPTACRGNAVSPCSESGSIFAFETSQQWLDSAFEATLVECLGQARFEKLFQLELEGGCPKTLSSSSPFTPAATECLTTRLNGRRWDCAVDLSCATSSAFFLAE